ncbi:unnamed protein product [Effrenium voratum]|uniref:Uncharacterized protein n=1 Tax=Effrenium voratum TaxID=2562239 RepID=A0AA36J8W0_9DINO|nr:unnamed protein product [Effrenium voratum]
MKQIQDEEDSGSNAAVFAALWRRRRKTWESTYLVGSCLPKDISFPSAAAAKLAKQPWVLGTTTGCGCLPCSKAGLSSDWARGTVKGFRAWFLHKHQESHNHVHAVKQMLCIGDGGGAGEAMALSEFEALLKNLQGGRSQRGCSSFEGQCSDKTSLMTWCLHEAITQADRDFLKTCETVSLTRDGRRQRLLIRFGGCNAQGTRKVLRDFCTKFHEPPRSYAGPPPEFDENLYDMLRQRIEIILTDAASNEIGASNVNRGRRDPRIEADDADILLPGLKLVARDHAHAFRRVLKRPFHCSSYLGTLMAEHVLGKKSIVQVIDRSFVFRQWFQEEVEKHHGTISNLKSAKHRFESHTTPLCRLISNLPAIMSVAQRIIQHRQDAVGKHVKQWLDDFSSEAVLALAMVADASDESLLLIRQVDDEAVDSSELGNYVQGFADRIQALFAQRQALTTVGYTKFAMDMLSKGELAFFSCGQARRLQPCDGDTVERCLDRMVAWSRLALEVLQTEFPHYSVFSAFGVFSLKSVTKQQTAFQSAGDDSCNRLAKFFNVSPGGFQEQLQRLRPLAEKRYRETNTTCKDAWMHTMAATQRRQSLKESYPADDLAIVVRRYLGWQASSSGVEQNFAKGERNNATGHSQASASYDARAMKILLAPLSPPDFTVIVTNAAELYATCRSGASRKRTQERIDKNVKRAKQEGTEAAFIRSRRDSVANATSSLNMADLAFDMDEHPATNDKVSEYWTESYEVEYQFQKSKQTHYKVDGVLDGLIDQNAVDQETMETAAKAERDADKKHIRDRLSKDALQMRLNGSMDWEKIQGSKAWLDPAISVADLQVAMSARNLVKTTERLEADIFIVNDAGNLPERVKLMAALLGRQIMDVCLLEGKKGILLKFQPASQTRRQKVFFSTSSVRATPNS